MKTQDPSPRPTDTGDASSSNASGAAEEKDAPGDWWDHCPLCGARLRNQGCKYRCPRCRYFMSCSDFD